MDRSALSRSQGILGSLDPGPRKYQIEYADVRVEFFGGLYVRVGWSSMRVLESGWVWIPIC